ncbi:MAG TPA: iron transporter FeoA [Lentisphaeria bacterium]|nr:MAG: iron transporter FeoA [Lentisphaerae bacterium GWF2_38_69]HBM15191.1 iron transporter FeoA [Lentisphaeria bacterium]
MIIPMRKMKVNQKGIIKSVSARGELGKRIRDMGILPGSEFMIIGKAPLYDPVALKLTGFTLTLRNSEADYITCEVDKEENNG